MHDAALKPCACPSCSNLVTSGYCPQRRHYRKEHELPYRPKRSKTKLADPSIKFNQPRHTIKIDSMREAALKAKNNPADERLFRWLRFNQWIITTLTTWLPLDLFEEAVSTWDREELAGLDCYLGMDLSSTTDLTSICLIFPPQGLQ